MMEVNKIEVFPIKGLKGFRVSSTLTEMEGLPLDRRWMLVDEQGMFISQRTHPMLTKVHCHVNANHLVVSYDNKELLIPMEPNESTMKVTIWEETIKANTYDKGINKWFTSLLKTPCFLVKRSLTSPRQRTISNKPYHIQVSLADGYPYLFCGTASLSNLNDKLDNAIPMSRFRTNFIIETKEPHIEDTWNRFKLGHATFKVIKPAPRCQVITIDQDLGTLSKEPLKTLATYRKVENKVTFGAYAILESPGLIQLGDKVELIN